MRARTRGLAVLAVVGGGLAVLAVLVGCRDRGACLFSTSCDGSNEDRDAEIVPVPPLSTSDAALEAECDDGIRYLDAGGGLDDGDGAPPGTRCSAAFDCAPIRCLCGDGGVGYPEEDAGSDAESDAGAVDASMTVNAVGVHACVCAVRACATPEEACALGTRYGACAPPPLTP